MISDLLRRCSGGSPKSGQSSAPTNIGGGVWGAYNRALERRPLLTKSITCGCLSFAADVVCQKAFPPTPAAVDGGLESSEGEGVALDWFRLTKFTVLGVIYVSPSLHVWYGYLARMFPGSGLTATMQRLACDQLIFAPAFIAGFLSLALVFEGRPEAISTKLRADWLSTMRANLSLWVPSMFINFRFVPQQYQVLFSNCVGFFWNIYLSYVVSYQPKPLPSPEVTPPK